MKNGLASSSSEESGFSGALRAAGTATAALDQDSFAAAWVAELFALLDDPSALVLLIRDPEGVLKLRGVLPGRDAISNDAKTATARIAETGKPALTSLPDSRFVIGAAVTLDGVSAVAVAQIGPMEPDDARRALSLLRATMGQVEAYLLNAQHVRDAQQDGAADAMGALAVMARSLDSHTYRDAAQRAATEMAQALGADRVSIARKRRGGAKLEALSHAADVKTRSDAADLIAAAADESLDQSAALIWPHEDDASAGATRAALAALARHSGAGGICALPMGDALEPWGALVAEFTFAEDAASAVARMDMCGTALAPLLEVKRRDSRWWFLRAYDAGVRGLGKLLGPTALGWKALAVVVLAGAIFLATFQAPTRVTADGVLISENRVMISAPFDGFLSDRLVRAGARVARDDILMTLDERELTLERLRFEASRNQKDIERDAAISERDRTKLSVLSAEIAEIDARLALTNARLEAGRMRAPFDGIVASDETTGRIGSPVGRGEELMQIAPLSELALELFVPDARVHDVQTGQTGTVRLSAFPDTLVQFEIASVTPLTEPRDGANTFRAHAQLSAQDLPEVTLGMEGVAKIEVGHGLWVTGWALPMLDAVRLTLWRWWP